MFCALCFTRPRYQVSVYRTIGPLVRFGFEGWIWVLIASVSGLCIFFVHLSQRLRLRRCRRRCRRCCRRPPFSNVFSSETAWPIVAKFYVEPPWERGTNVNINGPWVDLALFYGKVKLGHLYI